MKSTAFDLAFSKKVRELVAKHGIERDPNELIVSDEMADAIFRAGVELLADVGLYHMETQRVVEFTREEILGVAEAYRDNPPEAVFGQGEDRIAVRYRTCEEARPPILAAGPCGAIEQEVFDTLVRSLVEEPSNRALGIAGGVTAVDGVVPKVGTLSEMHCAQWECNKLLEIIDRAGRPGMHLGLLCTASSVGAIMACIRPGLREPHNTQIGIHIMPEQKIDWARLMLAKFCEDRGITPWTSCVSILGALCRHAADSAVGLVANLLGQLCYGHGSLANLFANHLDSTWADVESQWAFSGACRASERNIRVPIAGVCAPTMEQARTVAGLFQSVVMAVSNTASGFSYAWVAGASGLEARIIGEVMNAVAGMKREDASELLKRIVADIPKQIEVAPEPREMQEVYDMKAARPTPAYEAELLRGRDDLARLGVPFA